MLNLLWDQLKSKLHPSEIEEALFILDADKVERNEELSQEIVNLLDLFQEIPSRFQDLSSHRHKVEFYLSKLGNKAKELGVDTCELLALKTPRDKHIFEFLSDGGQSRSQTADTISQLADELPLFVDLNFIEENRKELRRALDNEYSYLNDRVNALQMDMLKQALVPTNKEVMEFSRRLEVFYR